MSLSVIEAGAVHLAHEQLQADDGVDDDDEQDQQGDVEERNHGLDDGVQHNLKAWRWRGDSVSHRDSTTTTRCHTHPYMQTGK
jgi:hypothetical protein